MKNPLAIAQTYATDHRQCRGASNEEWEIRAHTFKGTTPSHRGCPLNGVKLAMIAIALFTQIAQMRKVAQCRHRSAIGTHIFARWLTSWGWWLDLPGIINWRRLDLLGLGLLMSWWSITGNLVTVQVSLAGRRSSYSAMNMVLKGNHSVSRGTHRSGRGGVAGWNQRTTDQVKCVAWMWSMRTCKLKD